MKESVAIAKEANRKKESSPTRSDNSIQRLRNEPERQLGSLRGVIDNIRRDGGTPSVDSIATELSSMHTAQRAPALLALQRTHGNRYVQRVVAGIQAKLKVGQPSDIYEQEADRVAEAVMRMPEPQVQRQPEEEKKREKKSIQTKPLSDQINPLVQRQVEEEEPIQTKLLSTEHPILQRQEEEEILQPKAHLGQTPELTPDIESRIQTLKGGGKPLPASTRAFFEPRFGYDFSKVRVHTNAQADDIARAVNAQAFVSGSNIVFSTGQYAPTTTEGKRLLAHELTHVVQQRTLDTSSAQLRTIIQPATIDPGIAADQRRSIEAAGRRVPFMVASAVSVLRRCRNGTATSRQWNCVTRAFDIVQGSANWQNKIDDVITAYNHAQAIVGSAQCLISIRPGFNGWGYSPLGTAATGFTREIQVGTQFLSGNAGGWGGILVGCPIANDAGALRATTLIHEAIHWHNGVGGHAGLGHRRNPYNYETFIFDLRCGRSAP